MTAGGYVRSRAISSSLGSLTPLASRAFASRVEGENPVQSGENRSFEFFPGTVVKVTPVRADQADDETPGLRALNSGLSQSGRLPSLRCASRCSGLRSGGRPRGARLP